MKIRNRKEEGRRGRTRFRKKLNMKKGLISPGVEPTVNLKKADEKEREADQGGEERMPQRFHAPRWGLGGGEHERVSQATKNMSTSAGEINSSAAWGHAAIKKGRE